MNQRIAFGATGRRNARVLIVDDSAVAPAMMGQLVEADGRFRVVSSLSSVGAALAFLAINRVDIVLLDIAMPGTDGLTALPDLLAAGQGARIVIVSSSAEDGTAAAVQAMALGAADTLVKPSERSGGTVRFGEMLRAKLDRLLPGARAEAPAAGAPAAPDPSTARPAMAQGAAFDIVAIGASTGGIHALGQLLRAIPIEARAPILVTQHLPASFMPYFAAQLAVLASRPAEVAADRMRVRPGRILVAPGDAHMRCVALPDGGAAIRLSDEPSASGCMPSVDPMLQSVAEVFGSRAMGVLLSGMGRDGAIGARRLSDEGGCVLAQDRQSSVVWGMPGAVAAFADAVVPPDVIGTVIASGRRPA